jgi:hypothetical protein
MRAFVLSSAGGFAFWMFQSVGWETIIDKYGFPTLVAVAMFIYFQRQLSGTASALIAQQRLTDGYRAETLLEARSQTDFLRKLLDEARTQSACKFVEVKNQKREDGKNEV